MVNIYIDRDTYRAYVQEYGEDAETAIQNIVAEHAPTPDGDGA